MVKAWDATLGREGVVMITENRELEHNVQKKS